MPDNEAIGTNGAGEAPSWLAALPLEADDAERARHVLLSTAEDVGQVGSWAWNRDRDELFCSENLFRIYGLDPDETRLCSQVVVELTHPEDRPKVIDALELPAQEATPPSLSYRIIRADGEVRHLECAAMTICKEPAIAVGSVRDLTESRRAEREIEAHIAVGEALARWSSLEVGATDLLGALGESMGFHCGVFWIPDDDMLVPRFGWGADGRNPLSDVHELRLGADVGLSGRAWNIRTPVFARDLTSEPGYAFQKAALSGGVRGAVAVPAVADDEVLAVFGFASYEALERSDRLLRSLARIGNQVGEFLARRRGELDGSPLTPRQIEVLRLAACGRSVQEIAARLEITRATVRTHLDHIYDRLGVSDRVAAVAKALRQGLIQ